MRLSCTDYIMRFSLNGASETIKMRWLAPGKNALPNCVLGLFFCFAWRDILKIHSLQVTVETIREYFPYTMWFFFSYPFLSFSFSFPFLPFPFLSLFMRTHRKTLVFRTRKKGTCSEELVWFYLNGCVTLTWPYFLHFFDYWDTQIQFCSPLIANMQHIYKKNIYLALVPHCKIFLKYIVK